MKRKKRIYIIPGFGETTRSKNYREIIENARDFGFHVVHVNITWDFNLLMSDFIKQAEDKISDATIDDYILGFSFGAYISTIISVKKKVKGYIFCSISPYFKEDLKNIPKEAKEYFGKTLMNSFKKYSFPKKTTGRAWFLIGEKDWDIAIDRMHVFYNTWGGKKKRYIIKNAGHELSHTNYTKQVIDILKKP